jgi:hypothetical protein
MEQLHQQQHQNKQLCKYKCKHEETQLNQIRVAISESLQKGSRGQTKYPQISSRRTKHNNNESEVEDIPAGIPDIAEVTHHSSTYHSWFIIFQHKKHN